jgi:hypothetical protein
MAQEEQGKVGPLKKIVLVLEAGEEVGRLTFTPVPIRFALIYGLGVSGLCPLELALEGKREGDQFVLRLGKNDLPDFFQHISIPPPGIPEAAGAFTMRITVAEVSTPEQREVVRAMADMANCGSHCCAH